jgi:UDP-N-acetylmuramate--alanine ligase
VTRSAAEIGAGLALARRSRAIRPGERIHVVGVAGAGASAAALLAAGAGAVVSGCDAGGPSPYTPALKAAGILLAWDHDPEHVTGDPPPDRLAVSKALTAVDPDHAELGAARTRGILIEPWQQVVADAAFGKTLVAVAGTHGKSTTAGWLTHVLVQAGRDPSAFVGALLPESITGGLPATARQGRGALFVVEADEYAGNFDAYRPDLVLVTNVDFDHPDVFADLEATVSAFERWIERTPEAVLVVNALDPGAAALVALLQDRPGRVVRTGILTLDQPAGGLEVVGRLAIATPDSTPVWIEAGAARFRVELRTAGVHNASNALLVAAAGLELGLSEDELRVGLESFPGVGRRLERKGEAGGVVVYDDYGHHPTAIRATLLAVRQREPERRVWIACEPLTYHRTAALLDELAAALAEADGIAVADIWPGRDPDRSIASSAGLAAAVRELAPGKPVAAPGDVEATADWLAENVQPGDVVLVMGGGRSYVIADRLLSILAVGGIGGGER